MAITTIDGVVGGLATGQRLDFYKASATGEGAGTWHSLLALAGMPIAGSTPLTGTGAICVDTTSGMFTGITWSNTVYLLQGVVAGATAGKLILYDRLWADSGFVANTTALQSIVSMPAIPRGASSGTGVEIWGEVYGATGATGSVVTVIYTNSAGATSRTATYTQPANALSVGQMVQFFPVEASSGVTSVQSIRFTTSTGTAGNLGLTLLRRKAAFPIQLANAGDIFDFSFLGMPQIDFNAALCFMLMCSTTSTGIIQGALTFGNG